MSTLYIKFAHHIHDSWIDGMDKPHGPLFTQWLPNGVESAIELASQDSTMSIKIWFERYGKITTNHMDQDIIEFDYENRDVDPRIMEKQAILDAGPIHGEVIIADVLEPTIAVLQSDEKDNPFYMSLGKSTVNNVYITVNRFINILITVYGQYWLAPLAKWDSRVESLGGYCNSWNMRWSLDKQSWRDFLPNEPHKVIKLRAAYIEHFNDFLTQSDWNTLKSTFDSDFRPSIASEICNRARSLYQSGKLRYALIESMTCLEIVVDEYLAKKCHGPLKEKTMNRFRTYFRTHRFT